MRSESGVVDDASARRRLIELAPGEWPRLLGSVLYFFFVLASYYTLRPVRDAMNVQAGVEHSHYLFTATFACMLLLVPLYGWLLSRIPRRRLLPWVYGFFIANIIGFRFWFGLEGNDYWLSRAFFVWTSIFNLFVVSVFWSFMADLWNNEQSRRLFGIIAGGGTLGAIVGPSITAVIVKQIGLPDLLIISALLLGGALFCLMLLARVAPERAEQALGSRAMGGHILNGALLALRDPFLRKVTGFMFLGTMTGVLLYLQQARIVAEHFSNPAVVTSVFARIDLAVNLLTVVIQVTLTARIVKGMGLAVALATLPVVAVLGFTAISLVPALMVIVTAQVLRRAALFGITNPASNMIYTVVGPQSKYKFKHFVDTVIYRGGDASGSWLFAGLAAAGAGAAAVTGIGIAAVWAVLAWSVGHHYHRLRASGKHLP